MSGLGRQIGSRYLAEFQVFVVFASKILLMYINRGAQT